MIYQKNGVANPSKNTYYQCFEYMFILSKGKPKTFYPLKDRVNNWNSYKWNKLRNRKKDGSTIEKKDVKPIQPYGVRFNIWGYNVGFNHTTADKVAKAHPALMNEKLAQDHILSWSNPGDLVLDPFAGAGTTCKMAKLLGRKYIGLEISDEYCIIARQRLRESISFNDEQYRSFFNDFSN